MNYFGDVTKTESVAIWTVDVFFCK